MSLQSPFLSFQAQAIGLTVDIKASDSSDPVTRFWQVWFDKSPGNYLGGGQYDIPPDYENVFIQGALWEFLGSVPAGTHTVVFGVTQSGGPSFGTYSGTISIKDQNGVVLLNKSFSGVDVSHQVSNTFTAGQSAPPPSPISPVPPTIPPTAPAPGAATVLSNPSFCFTKGRISMLLSE